MSRFLQRSLQLSILVSALAACSADKTSLEFYPTELPAAEVGEQYTAVVNVKGNQTPVSTARVVHGKVPPGISMSVAYSIPGRPTIVFSGVATEAGLFSFRILVRCFGTSVAGQVGEESFSIRVVDGAGN